MQIIKTFVNLALVNKEQKSDSTKNAPNMFGGIKSLKHYFEGKISCMTSRVLDRIRFDHSLFRGFRVVGKRMEMNYRQCLQASLFSPDVRFGLFLSTDDKLPCSLVRFLSGKRVKELKKEKKIKIFPYLDSFYI